jgi:hypothetical protein
MARYACVLVRIAVRLPEPVSPHGDDFPQCPCCDHPCLRPATDAPIAPDVTLEMLAFYREHPDTN